MSYNISEIYKSIQGEGTKSGLLCTFIRMQGCNIRCSWCDTPYALELKKQERLMTGEEIIAKIAGLECNYLLFTGGEPLAQPGIIPLMDYLCDLNYSVAIETSGTLDVSKLDKRIIKILDLKCPGSGMEKFNLYDNINFLNLNDEVKFVINDELDYQWSIKKIENLNLTHKVNTILFSPVFGHLDPRSLAEWIIRDNLPVRLQLQMHKYIWDPSLRGV